MSTSANAPADLAALNEKVEAANDLRHAVTTEFVALVHQRLRLRLTAAMPEGGVLDTELFSEVGDTDVTARHFERLDGSVVETDGGDDSPEAFVSEDEWELIVEDLRLLLWYGKGVFWRKGFERFDFPAAQQATSA